VQHIGPFPTGFIMQHSVDYSVHFVAHLSHDDHMMASQHAERYELSSFAGVALEVPGMHSSHGNECSRSSNSDVSTTP
jgi:hypothetical protein